MKKEALAKQQKILLTFDEICTATSGRIFYNAKNVKGIYSIAIDSRNCIEGSLFVPLRGEVHDGHAYCKDALENAASSFFVDEKFFVEKKTDVEKLCKLKNATCIVVNNNLYALQACAEAYVKKFPKLKRIGITGSSGKSTTKEILASILVEYRPTVFSKGNYNSETGLPLSVFNIKEEDEYAVFELGMNRKNEIAELAKILKPQVAIITNIGTAHIGMLGSEEKIAEEKKKIFLYFDSYCVGFFPDDKWSDFLSKGVSGSLHKVNVKKGINEKFLNLKDLGLKGYEFEYSNKKVHFRLLGEHNLSNALMAVCVAEVLNVDSECIIRGLEKVKPLHGRSEVLQGLKSNYMFDAYNANPQSMLSAIEFLEKLKVSGRKIAVFGSMLELGEYSFEAHKNIIERIKNSDLDLCFLYGDEFALTFNRLNFTDKKFLVYKTNEADTLSKRLETEVNNCDFVVLKGSRSLRLERFVASLGGQMHES